MYSDSVTSNNYENNLNNLDIKYGKENYDSTDKPLFHQNVNSNNIENNCESIIQNNDNIELIDKFKKLIQDEILLDFYINNNAYNKELYINNWTFMSIKKILEINEQYKSDHINNIVDIGFRYSGLGWIKLAFYDTELKKILYRMDGGSNGYDRADNYNKLKRYKSSSYVYNGISFTQFLNEINDMDSESEIIRIM